METVLDALHDQIHTMEEVILEQEEEIHRLNGLASLWFPAAAIVCGLFYMHGAFLGVYLCPK